MARIEKVIQDLEEMTKKIADRGKLEVQKEIMAHDHIETGRMFNSVQITHSLENASIRVNTYYAHWVNDGRGPVVPRHRMTWTSRNRHVLHWVSNKTGEVFTPYASAYAGSKFFDSAYEALLAYIHTL